MAPNVLLLVMDAARRDAFTPYGAGPRATPNIDALAARGHALPRAYATSSWTLPSHASLLAGRLPGELGLGQAPTEDPRSARPVLAGLSDRLLPAVLGRAGYRCEGFSANLWASDRVGFDTGFDAFTYVESDRVERANTLLGSGLRAQLAWAAEGLAARTDAGAAALGRALRSSIGTWSGQPTFWFVNLVEAHSPYLPPRPWNDLGPLERVRAARDCQRHLGFEAICLHAAGRTTIPPEAIARLRHLHDRAVSYMDAWLGQTLAALEERGILDETLVIVTADHGESFGEDGMLAHGFSLAEQLIHVPLVIAGPGAREHAGPFSLARLPQLIAGAAGAPGPYLDDDLPSGVAVAEYQPMAGAEHPRVQAFAAKWGLGPEEVRRLTTGTRCATDGELKLVVSGDGREVAFDLRADPQERSPREPSTLPVEPLRAALKHDVPGREPAAAGPARPAAAPPTASADELAALERQMKLLGYM